MSVLPPDHDEAAFAAYVADLRGVVGDDWVWSGDNDMFPYRDSFSPVWNTPEEIQACIRKQEELAGEGKVYDLGRIMVKTGVITASQLKRLVNPSPEDSLAPSVQQIPGFKIMQKIGAGAMASVYKARQLSLDRIVAIKILPKRLSEDAEDALGVKFRLLRELVRSCDVLSLNVPLNASTRGMIGAEELALMKPTAIIVNTCRGPVIDEKALYTALSTGRLFGAGLDVFDPEPPVAGNPLLTLDNVVLTAHFAGPTWDNHVARFRNAFDNVERVERGEAPLWVVPELAG